MLKFLIVVLWIFFGFSVLLAQQFERYGLDEERINDLKVYGETLFAGTDDGLYVRKQPDSSWIRMGLEDISVRSVYPHDVGPLGWGVTVGTQPSYTPDDSALTYCWTSYNPKWTASDSGIDRSCVFGIYALGGFPDPRI